MQHYPDADKLIFFGPTDDDDDGSSSEEEEDEEYMDRRKSLEAVLNASEVVQEQDTALILQMLTWSVKQRITTVEVCDGILDGAQETSSNLSS